VAILSPIFISVPLICSPTIPEWWPITGLRARLPYDSGTVKARQKIGDRDDPLPLPRRRARPSTNRGSEGGGMMTGPQTHVHELTTAQRPSDVPTLVNVQPLETPPLFSESELGEFRSRWSNVQTGFVDEPRRTVEEAGTLVASVMQRLAEGFANERSGLEKQWDC
jgi:hypothetical protein